MQISYIQLTSIVDRLRGNYYSLDEIVKDVCGQEYSDEDLSKEQLKYIDDRLFECERCNYWYDLGNMSEDRICIECV